MIDRGDGAPVVLVPGIQGRWEWMAPTVDALAARCRVITFSLADEPTSGFPWDPAHGFDNYLRQIDEALDRVRVGQALLLGVSYGGLIATDYAARRPDRVRGLVLASALPPGWTPDRRARFYMRAPLLLSALFVAGSPLRLMPEINAAFPEWRARARFTATHTARVLGALMSPSRMARRARWADEHEFADPAGVRAPALVITGEDALDRVVRTELTRRYLSCLPSCRHAVLARTGHIGVVTRPHEFVEHVCRFAEDIAQDGQRISA